MRGFLRVVMPCCFFALMQNACFPSSSPDRPRRAVGTSSQRSDYDDLRACENTALPAEQCQRAAARFKQRCTESPRDPTCEMAPWVADSAATRVCTEHGVAVCRAACDAGDGSACMQLGLMYGRGKRVEKDSAMQAELTDKACTLGSPMACMYLEPHCDRMTTNIDHDTCNDLLGRSVSIDVALDHYRDECRAKSRSGGTQFMACADLLAILDHNPTLGKNGEEVALMRMLCATKKSDYTQYCGLLRDRGMAP